MSDVGERERREDKGLTAQDDRTTLVARALGPILRFTGPEISLRASRVLTLRREPNFEIEGKTRNHVKAIRWSFVVCVLLPMLLSGTYFLLWASDKYVAEARFAVREVDMETGEATEGDKGGTTTGGGLGLTMNMKTQNAEIIASYIKSRAIVDDVSRTLDLRAIFQRPGADFLARLPGNASEEDLVKYWNDMVSVYIQTSSGIVLVSASAFRRDDALALANAIVAASETLANSLSAKIRADQTRLAEDEVRRAEGEVRFALSNLQDFRNSSHVIDPVKSSASAIKLLYGLIEARIQAEVQYDVAQRSQGPEAPGIGSLKAKIDSLKTQIKETQDKLAGDEDVSKNMAATITRFEELELKKQFAEKVYTFAQNGVERARLLALRQAIYVSVFVSPSLPQDATFPLRWSDFLLISIGAFMIWVSGLTMAASIVDHRI